MKLVKRLIRRIDAFQQGRPVLSFLWAVVKKFGDDSAGSLAALVAYYGFLSLFPLLLVLITILGLIATPSISHRVVNSALGQFPIVGSQLTGPNGIHALKAGSVVGLIIGLVGLVWGSLGICQAAQRAMAGVWNVPKRDTPGYVSKLLRSVEFLIVLLLDVVVTTALAGISTFAGHGLGVRIGAAVLTFVVDVGLYILAFRVLTPASIPTRFLVRGAAAAGVAWAILQYVGTFLVGHQLKHAHQIYGYFGSILGLLAFLFLAAQITLYAAEVNVVRERHLYPRSLSSPPLTAADRLVSADLARAADRRPHEEERAAREERAGGEAEAGAGGAGGSGGTAGGGPVSDRPGQSVR
ncbi:MAG: YihY/virulence factor BrkB family protein [Acidimicrobiales bacterium]